MQTVSAIYSFFLAMTLYPEVQKRAQAELDAVLGADRLPTLVDRERLPYVDALVKEVLRWGCVAPQGLPHALRENDVCAGYLIPKGAILVANIWFVLSFYRRPRHISPLAFLFLFFPITLRSLSPPPPRPLSPSSRPAPNL